MYFITKHFCHCVPSTTSRKRNKNLEIQGLQGSQGCMAGDCDYCLPLYYITKWVCAEAQTGKNAEPQSCTLFHPLLFFSLLQLILNHPCWPDPDHNLGGMRLQEAWRSWADSASPMVTAPSSPSLGLLGWRWREKRKGWRREQRGRRNIHLLKFTAKSQTLNMQRFQMFMCWTEKLAWHGMLLGFNYPWKCDKNNLILLFWMFSVRTRAPALRNTRALPLPFLFAWQHNGDLSSQPVHLDGLSWQG